MSVKLVSSFLVACLALLLSAPVWGTECPAPPYVIVKRVYRSGSTFIANISIPPDRFSRADLLCLGKKLKQRFSRWTDVHLAVFNSKQAAQQIQLGAYTVEATSADRALKNKMHADVELNAKGGEDYVMLYPQGDSLDFAMRIDLRGETLPDCSIPFLGRCLIQFDRLRYPREAWWGMATGSVTIRAVIAPNGSVREAQVVAAHANVSPGVPLLRAAALENFRSWYFERGQSLQPITVTFEFDINGDPNPTIKTDLRFLDAGNVMVTTNPPLEGQREPLKP